MPENRTEGALGDLLMIRHRDAAKRRLRLAKHDVASLLPIDYVARLFERLDELPARNDGKPSQALDLDNLFGDWRRHWVAMSFQ